MKTHKKGRTGSMLAAAIVIAALLGACGTDTPTGSTVTTVSGVVTAGTPTAGMKTCTSCHPTVTGEWMKSRHANVEPPGNLDSKGSPNTAYFFDPDPATNCIPCHDPIGDSRQLVASYTGNTVRPVVGCESCHGGGKLHADAGGSGPISNAAYTAGLIGGTSSSLQVSAQFKTCSFKCHELLDPDDPANKAIPLSNATHSTFGPGSIIIDTHFATGETYTNDGRNTDTFPLGYSMDYASEKVCTNCHDPHGTADIARDWVNGPHGNTTQGTAEKFAWSAYNWSCQTGSVGCNTTEGTGDIPRPFCLRCHTMTGYIAYADALAAGNSQRVSDIWNGRIPLLTYDPFWAPEMLQCNGCHTDNQGAIRNPGAYNAIYGYRVGQPFSASTGTPVIVAYASFQYPDVSTSNQCIPCHSGRISGRTIKALNTVNSGTTTTVNFGALRLQNSHLMPTAGVMFKGVGYEYEGRDYSNPPSYTHDKVGTAAVPNTGTGGPCVGCHMYRPGAASSHLFTNVSSLAFVDVSTGTTVTVTTVSSTVCFECHAESSTDLGFTLDDEHFLHDNAVLALNTQLIAKGLNVQNFLSRTPFYLTNDTDTTGNTTGKNNLGAAFNRDFLNSTSRFSAAYVHNNRYAKRLLYDSIDWVDDNKMNYSVGTTLATYCTTTPSTWCGGAMLYLLPNGVIIGGAPSERP